MQLILSLALPGSLRRIPSLPHSAVWNASRRAVSSWQTSTLPTIRGVPRRHLPTVIPHSRRPFRWKLIGQYVLVLSSPIYPSFRLFTSSLRSTRPCDPDRLRDGNFGLSADNGAQSSGKQYMTTETYEAPHGDNRRWYQDAGLVLRALKRRDVVSYGLSPFMSDNSPRRASLPSSLASNGVAGFSLASILARYVESIQDTSPRTRKSFAFTPEELKFLSSEGYGAPDVDRWGKSLLEPASSAAVSILLNTERPLPVFVLLVFLHRLHIGFAALKALLTGIQGTMKRTPDGDLLLIKSMFALAVRHACREWPESLPFLATAVVECISDLDVVGTESSPASPDFIHRLTELCNFFLVQFSRVVSINPALSSVHQARAQLHILRFMQACSPTLAVTRDGYRATAKVQIAHRKTDREREWTQLQSASWPPWKASKTAIDEETDIVCGSSRVRQVIERMQAAGYATGTWENVLQIYAGWDTDGSPTVQQRTPLKNLPWFIGEETARELEWEARILATRTRREAWACFLAYEATGASASSRVYRATFERMFHGPGLGNDPLSESNRSTHPSLLPGRTLPGDGREIWAEPVLPENLTYINERLPTFEQLYIRMVQKGLQPSKRLLARLIDLSSNLGLALKILETAQSYHAGLRTLLALESIRNGAELPVPTYLFDAFVGLLCRFGKAVQVPRSLTINEAARLIHARRLQTDGGYLIDYAYHLIELYRPKSRPAWTALMRGIFNAGSLSALAKYKALMGLLPNMEKSDLQPDCDQFQMLCTALAYAVREARPFSAATPDGRWLFHHRQKCSLNVHRLFNAVTGSHAPLGGEYIRTPEPAALHAYVRAIGLLRSYEGLYSVSMWLNRHHTRVLEKAQTKTKGLDQLRRALVALRFFLESNGDGRGGKEAGAPAEMLELVKAQISAVPDFGGWPTDEEVQLYIKAEPKSRLFRFR